MPATTPRAVQGPFWAGRGRVRATTRAAATGRVHPEADAPGVTKSCKIAS